MLKRKKSAEGRPIALILGAGASRGVSYALSRPILSPLDGDFFELLQRLRPSERDADAINKLIAHALKEPVERFWDSMERMFYTLHLRAEIHQMLFEEPSEYGSPKQVLGRFARAIQALLRTAHGKKTCSHHVQLFRNLKWLDAIVTFNYDLVPERALRALHSKTKFGEWLYGFGSRPRDSREVPDLYKLHGSVNWEPDFKRGYVWARQNSWKDFDSQPGYRAHGPAFPILLPHWDKKVEKKPWRTIWQLAAEHLRQTSSLIIWGYSLPLTDLKAQALVKICLTPADSILKNVCVIDPNRETRTRWRTLFLRQKFWQYEKIEDFLETPPDWWL